MVVQLIQWQDLVSHGHTHYVIHYNFQRQLMMHWIYWIKLIVHVQYIWVLDLVLIIHIDWLNIHKLNLMYMVIRTGKMIKHIQELKEWYGKHIKMIRIVLLIILNLIMGKLHLNWYINKLLLEVKLVIHKLLLWISQIIIFMLCILILLHAPKDIQDQQLKSILHQDLKKNGIDFIYLIIHT